MEENTHTLGRTVTHKLYPVIAQLVERLTVVQLVGDSISSHRKLKRDVTISIGQAIKFMKGLVAQLVRACDC